MNYFTLIKNKDGSLELITCNLDGTILPGVTRQSVIELVREMGIKVSEREFLIDELIQIYDDGRVRSLIITNASAFRILLLWDSCKCGSNCQNNL